MFSDWDWYWPLMSNFSDRGRDETTFLGFVVSIGVRRRLLKGFHAALKAGVAALVALSWAVGLRLRDVYAAIVVVSGVELFFSQVHL